MKNKILQFAFAWLFFFGATPVIAQNTVTLDELNTIKKHLDQRDVFAVDFHQVVTSARRKHTSKPSDGRAIFGRPNNFRWILETPHAEELIYDGKNFIQYLPTEKVASKVSPGQSKRQQIEEVVAAVISLDVLLSRYEIVKSSKTATNVLLELKPKKSADISKILLNISTKQNFVESVHLFFAEGSNNLISFSEPKIVTRNPGTFAFNPPLGVKVNEL